MCARGGGGSEGVFRSYGIMIKLSDRYCQVVSCQAIASVDRGERGVFILSKALEHASWGVE